MPISVVQNLYKILLPISNRGIVVAARNQNRGLLMSYCPGVGGNVAGDLNAIAGASKGHDFEPPMKANLHFS